MERTALSGTAICEIGPLQIRRLGCDTTSLGSREVTAALEGGDDALVLLDDRPVAVAELWPMVLEPLLRDIDDTILVHPSWWPTTRVETVSAQARQLCDRVVTCSRARFLSAADVLVEIAAHLVTVSKSGEPVLVRSRSGAPGVVAEAVARAVRGQTCAEPVWLDGPAGVPGAAALAAMIDDQLRAGGIGVRRVSERDLTKAAVAVTNDGAVAEDPPRPVHRRTAAVVGSVLTGVVATGWWAGIRGDATSSVPPTALVEGQVALEIPADWAVQRITSGPGSARVQVVSPTDDRTALHLTQSRVHNEDLTAAAGVLRKAFDSQPAGVFVDFHPSDVRGDRPAVTYREIRPGHEIRWAVILDGDVRISIGCQSATGRERDMAAVCEQAVRTAHAIT